MEYERYFRLSLLFPIILPLVFLPLMMVSRSFSIVGALFLFFSMVSVLFFGLIISGLGYIVFAYIVFSWSKKQQPKTLKISTIFLPIAFIPFSIFFIRYHFWSFCQWVFQ